MPRNKIFWAMLVFSMMQKVWGNEMCADSYTTDLAILKTNLFPVNLRNPEEDLKIRIKHGDYRFLSMNGLIVTYHGLNFPEDKLLLCLAGEKNIEGTSDALDGEEHADLVIKFTEYTAIYNSKMKQYLKKLM